MNFIRMIEEQVLWKPVMVPRFCAIMQIDNGALIAYLKNLQCHIDGSSSCRGDAEMCVMEGHSNGLSGFFFCPSLLTEPMPESATDSLPESVACVLFPGCEAVFSVPLPMGQSVLALT